MRLPRVGAIALLLFSSLAGSARAQTIVAETEATWMFADGKVVPDNSGYTVTYEIVGDLVTRTRLVENGTGEVTQDDTIYSVVDDLLSHDLEALAFDPEPCGDPFACPVIRAVGSPAADAVEILIIGQSFVRSVRSSGDGVILVEMKRLRD